MNKLLFLLSCILMGHPPETDAVTVEWPSGYSVEWSLRDESARYSLTVKQYTSQDEKAFRWDTYGGMNTFILNFEPSPTVHYYFPSTNDTTANVTNCFYMPVVPWWDVEKFPPGLPDLNGYSHAANLTISGVPAQKWISRPESGEEDLVWLHMGESTERPVPIKFVKKQTSRDEHDEFGAMHFVVEYYNYQPEEPDKSVWHGPKNVNCQQANEVTNSLVNDFIFAHFSAVSFPMNVVSNDQKPPLRTMKRSKGLIIGNRPKGSALPFPYSDDDIRRMASQLPESFDWRIAGAVTSVKDQGACGSCWAFSLVGAMEGAYFRKYGTLGDMSVQALLDCGWWTDPKDNNSIQGCFGGYPTAGLDWIKNHGGLPWAADYGDYKQSNGRCVLSDVTPAGPIKGYVQVNNDIVAVKVALYHHGPLMVAIATPDAFMNYRNGVIKNIENPGPVDHGVLLVGYGSLNGEDYWIIKNSWGEQWGLLGYGLISSKNDTLFLLDLVYYPVLV